MEMRLTVPTFGECESPSKVARPVVPATVRRPRDTGQSVVAAVPRQLLRPYEAFGGVVIKSGAAALAAAQSHP